MPTGERCAPTSPVAPLLARSVSDEVRSFTFTSQATRATAWSRMRTTTWSSCLPRSSENGYAYPASRWKGSGDACVVPKLRVGLSTLLTTLSHALAADHREAAHHPAARCSHRPSRRSTSGSEAAEDDHGRARDKRALKRPSSHFEPGVEISQRRKHRERSAAVHSSCYVPCQRASGRRIEVWEGTVGGVRRIDTWSWRVC